MSLSPSPAVFLRRATPAYACLPARWDQQPLVIACATDDPDALAAFARACWLART